jgi:glucokinase
MSDTAILVGDAGGTNVRFAVAHVEDGAIRLSPVWKRPGADYATFDAALEAWLAEARPKLSGAAFGFAGAVIDGRVDMLNRDWSADRRTLVARLGLADVVVVNDFFAMARAAPELGPDEVADIAPGDSKPEGSIAVGGPGTGFGIGVLRRAAPGWVVVAGEGGHQTYSPQTDLEWKVADAMGLADPGLSQKAVIAAAKAGDRFALAFCRLRARAVMTTMGNLALSSNATGGVFLAGGVTQHLVPWLTEAEALARFYSRGPRTELLSRFPIRLITGEAAPLLGAAHLWLDQKARGWL